MTNKTEIEFHPAANLFPLIEGEDFAALCEDLKRNGQLEDIVIYQGMILDGRNRFRACDHIGIEPRFKEWGGECGSPTRYVLSINMQRRHLTASQKAAVGLGALPMLEAEAAERKRESLKGNENARRSQQEESLWEEGENDERNPALIVSEPKSAKASNEAASIVGCSPRYVEDAKAIARVSPELLEEVRQGRLTIPQAKREIKRAEVKLNLEEVAAAEIIAPPQDRRYNVLVIDPPWPIEKIERDCRPDQVELDYPTMSLEEIEAIDVNSRLQDDAHVWLWTTQRFLPASFKILKSWGLKYVCAFVWHKPGGFQPVGLPQYNCEFALYARKGSPPFLDTKALPLCFMAPRGAHSEKPEAFYETLRRVTGGIRLDWFNRRAIEGFDVLGKEAQGDQPIQG